MAHDLCIASQKHLQDFRPLGSDKNEWNQWEITHSSFKVMHFPRAMEPLHTHKLCDRYIPITTSFGSCQSWLYSFLNDTSPINLLTRICFWSCNKNHDYYTLEWMFMVKRMPRRYKTKASTEKYLKELGLKNESHPKALF